MTFVIYEVIIKLVKEYFEDLTKKYFLIEAFRGVEGKNNPFFSDAFVECGGKLVKNHKFKAPQFKKNLRNALIGKLRTQIASKLGPAFEDFLKSNAVSKQKGKENSEMGLEPIAVTKVMSEILVENSSISEMGCEPRNFQFDYEIDQVDFGSSQEKNFEAADVEMVDDPSALHKIDTEICDLNLRQFVCTEFNCKKAFKKNKDLTKHMRVVHGEKKFSCSQCEWKFTAIADLNRHKKTHFAKPTVMSELHCSICFKLFLTKERLKLHARVHNDDKQKHDCKQCEKSYSFKHHLTRHIKQQHEKIRFNCATCQSLCLRNIHSKGIKRKFDQMFFMRNCVSLPMCQNEL